MTEVVGVEALTETVLQVLSWEATTPEPESWGGVRAEARDALAALSVLAARATAAEEALRGVDAMLTTVSEDNVPRGEACKLQARAIARGCLAGGVGAEQDTARAAGAGPQ